MEPLALLHPSVKYDVHHHTQHYAFMMCAESTQRKWYAQQVINKKEADLYARPIEVMSKCPDITG